MLAAQLVHVPGVFFAEDVTKLAIHRIVFQSAKHVLLKVLALHRSLVRATCLCCGRLSNPREFAKP